MSILDSSSAIIAQLTSSAGPKLTSTQGTISSISMTISFTTISSTTDFTIIFTPTHSSSGITQL